MSVPLQLLILIICLFCLFFFRDDGEYESRLSQSKLTQLCEFDPVITFVKACDHLLYQTLVEILIPDVLRPIPGTYNYVILTAECYYNMLLLWLVIYNLYCVLPTSCVGYYGGKWIESVVYYSNLIYELINNVRFIVFQLP